MTFKSFTAIATVLTAAVALSSCRGDEQGRVTLYKKGEYLGQKDDTLSEVQLTALRERSVLAVGSDLGLSATVTTRGGDVRLDGEAPKK